MAIITVAMDGNKGIQIGLMKNLQKGGVKGQSGKCVYKSILTYISENDMISCCLSSMITSQVAVGKKDLS
jgi:hypothetical protein